MYYTVSDYVTDITIYIYESVDERVASQKRGRGQSGFSVEVTEEEIPCL